MATHLYPVSRRPLHRSWLLAISSAIPFACFLAVNSLYAQSNNSDATFIRGVVVNNQTHEPIGHALVYSPDNRFATLTDDRGRFQFNLSSTGNVRNTGESFPNALMARKPGFLPINYDQQILQSSDDLSAITIPLVPEALIVGHVQTSGAAGFDRIQVELFRRNIREGAEHWDSAGIFASRSNGEFRFAELQAGSYKLVTHEFIDRDPTSFNPRGPLIGYPPVFYPSAPDFSTASVIRLEPGATYIANISAARREYYPVKIKLTNPPADNAIGVHVWPQGRPGPGYSLGYNPGEQTILGSLPDGSYVIQVSSYGPHAMNGAASLLVKGAPVDGQTVSLEPTISIPVSIRLEFQHQETLAQISSSGNERVPNAGFRLVNVNLLPTDDYGGEGGASMRHAQNPEDDSPPMIENVFPGRYRVIVNTPFGFPSSVTSGGINLLNQPLVVSPGGAVSPIEIILRDDGAEIDGMVEDSSSPPASTRHFQGQVYFIPLAEGGGQLHMTWIMADGRFQLRQLPPGSYRVLAFNRSLQELEYTNAEATKKFDSKSQVIQVSPGQKQHLRLPLISWDE